MRIKSTMLTTTAFFAATGVAFAADDAESQTPDTPAATIMAPTPTLTEEIVYMRDQMAAQALRLDQAEQSIERQQKLIDLQEQKIAQLEAELAAARTTQTALVEAAQTGSFNTAALGMGGVYVVKKGDTLGTIARRNGSTVRQLARANNIRSPYRLSIGQQIKIPGAPATARIASDARVESEYTVSRGDTLGAIARRNGSTIRELARANNLRSPYRLSVGQKIKIPGAPAPARVASAETPAPSTQTVEQKVQQPATANEPQAQQQRVAANTTQTPPGPQEDPGIQDRAIAEQRRREDPGNEDLPQEVGVRPEDEDVDAPYLALFSDVGGILTPKGTLFVEPAVEFTASSDNRFFFDGVEIVDAILIGAIQATDTDRLAITERVGVRYGVTSRLEVDASIPYVYREDRLSGVAIDDLTRIDDARYGSGIGDVAFGVHYQLNEGKKWPYLIANLRAKAPTGEGPFDVDRAPNGQEVELATGSGYWSIEPSLSFILPSAPASIFGNIGYQANLSVTPDQLLATSVNESPNNFTGPVDSTTGLPTANGIFQTEVQSHITDFNPGDAITASVGVGLSLNERLSMNFGYDHRYFLSTKTVREETVTERNLTLDRDIISEEVQPTVTRRLTQNPSTVGSFLFGASYLVNDRLRLNLNTGIGATDEAADFRVSLRAQIKLSD